MKKRLLLLMLVLAGACYSSVVRANPVFGQTVTDKQPDRTLVTFRVWGDEFFNFIESTDGYTLIRQQDGWICYAKLSGDDRELVSTGVRLSGQTAAMKPLGLAPHLRITAESKAQKITQAKSEILGSALKTSQKVGGNRAISIGSPKGITLVIDFSDQPGTIPRDDIYNLLNQPGYTGYGNDGSVRDYFYDVSGGKLIYTNYVPTAYYRAKYPKSYYDNQTAGKPLELLREALLDLDAKGFDFSQYDLDGNGYVDAINAFYAGNPTWGWAKGLWPHAGGGINLTLDGKKLDSYEISNLGANLSIKTFCHENGHLLLGYPDLYDGGYESNGVGNYCLMAYGNQINAYLKLRSGWATVTELTAPAANLSITANAFKYYKYTNPAKPTEFFIIDNRNRTTVYDSTVPDEGIIVYHVDETGSNDNEQMTAASHYMVTVVQADGYWDLEHGFNWGDSTDLFDASSYNRLNATSNPDSDWWDGSDSGFDLHDVGPLGPTMAFSFGINDLMTLSPANGFSASGYEGGPFAPAGKSFTLTNTSGATINWTASSNASWVSLSSSGGNLAARASITLNISLGSAAQQLLPGDYEAVVTVTDTSTGATFTPKVALSIKGRKMIAYWPLNEGAGTLAADAAGQNFDGTLMSTDIWSATGRYGVGLSLAGTTTNYVDVPAIGLNSDMATLSAWIKRNGNQMNCAGIVFWRGNSTVAGLDIVFNNNLGYHWNGSPSTYNFNSSLTLPDGVWCFVALVVEPTRATLYLHDGTSLRKAINNVTHNPEGLMCTGSIGRDSYSTDRMFKGQIDDVRVYNYSMTEAEITNLYNNAGGGAFNPQPAHGATNIISRDLRWSASPGATTHNFYLGTDATAVRNASTASVEFKGNLSRPFYPAAILTPATIYYWRVDEVCPVGIIPGAVWCFTTASSARMPTPIAHWLLDDAIGVTARDARGSFDGTVQGAATWTAGKYQGAINCDGGTGYVGLPALNLNSNTVTISAWVKPAGTQDAIDGLVFWRGGHTVAGMHLNRVDQLGYHWNNQNYDFRSGLIVRPGIWNFVALAVQADKATLYLFDGNRWQSSVNAVTHAIEEFDGPGCIGLDSAPGWNRYFKGVIDDVRVYNNTLSAAELAMAAQSISPLSAAINPSPADQAHNIPRTGITLSWTAGTEAILYDVYFGPTYPPQYWGRQTGTTFNVGTLAGGSYYWRIDSIYSDGTAPGPDWSFSTFIGNAADPSWALYGYSGIID